MTADKAMASNVQDGVGPLPNPWRRVVWGTAAFLLLLPLFAMQFTEEVNWDAVDFIAFGAMLLAACGAYELTTGLSGNSNYRAAFGLAVAASFVLVWVNLAVGIIGRGNNAAKTPDAKWPRRRELLAHLIGVWCRAVRLCPECIGPPRPFHCGTQ